MREKNFSPRPPFMLQCRNQTIEVCTIMLKISDAHLAYDRRKGKASNPQAGYHSSGTLCSQCWGCAVPQPWVGQQGCSSSCRANWSSYDKVDRMFVGTGVFAVRLRKGFSALLCCHLCYIYWNAVSVISAVLLFLYIVVCSHKGLNQMLRQLFWA